MNNHTQTIKIKAVIQDYMDGTFEADIEKLQSVFHPSAVMNGFLGEQLLIASPQAFIDDMKSHPSMASEKAPYSAQIESIRVEGAVADVILSETGFKGSGKLVNFFHLIQDNGEWKIISKLFTTLA